MNGGEGNDVILDIEEENYESRLALNRNDKSLSRNLINRIVTFIQEANSTHDLVEVSTKAFEITLKLINSV